MKKRNLFALALLLVSATAFVVSNHGIFSGFFGLAATGQKALLQNPDINTDAAGSQGFDAKLSMDILGESSVTAVLFLAESVPDCPGTSDANVLLKNSGKAALEALRIKPGSGIELRACSDCSIERLGVGEEKIVSMKLCIDKNESNALVVSAANSESVELPVGKN